MLSIESLNVYYGVAHVVQNVSFTLNKGETTALIGINGAGKSTILRSISGLKKVKSGKIKLYDRDITNIEPYDIVNNGVIHVPEGRRIFLNLTVYENLVLGAYSRKDNIHNIHKQCNEIYEKFPLLKSRANKIAGDLSGGEQQMLAICRALMSNPELLLLDEPFMGLSPIMKKNIASIIQDLKSGNITLLIVEQNIDYVLSFVDNIIFISNGVIEFNGIKKEALANNLLKNMYLV